MGETGIPQSGPIDRKMQSYSDRMTMTRDLSELTTRNDMQQSWIQHGLLAARPAFGYNGRIYIATDAVKHIYLDDGTQWITIL